MDLMVHFTTHHQRGKVMFDIGKKFTFSSDELIENGIKRMSAYTKIFLLVISNSIKITEITLSLWKKTARA